MKLKSDIIWAAVLISTAVLFFYLGTNSGTLSSEKYTEGKNKEQAEKIAVLENKIQQLSEELKSRGIYSHPQANVFMEKGSSATKVLIILNGKDAIPNLQIDRKLLIDSSDDDTGNFEELAGKAKTTHIDVLTAHNPVAFEIDGFKNKIALDLSFKSEDNQWHQYLIGRKTGKGEIKTFWVLTNQDSEVIDKHVDPGFPKDIEGNLLLGKKKKVKYAHIQMNSIFQPDLIF